MKRFRIPALFCALTFLLCELASKPFAEMGLCDDWSYVRTAEILAQTGHIVYNGWATAMLGWQLYFAAAFIKIAGPSFAAARMSTVVVGMATAFLTHRIFVRAGVNERNATIGTLAVVLSPIFMLLSASFMSDVQGVFAIAICLYGCVRAVQSATTRAAIAWLCFAGASNAIFGTARQIAWLGVLVMVPCTAWLLRGRRGVLLTGILVALAGGVFIAGCMHWFQQQPYALAESALVRISSLRQIVYMARQLTRGVLEVPFLILPVLIAFLAEIRRGGRRFLAVLAGAAVVYTLVAIRMTRAHGADMTLQPLLGDWLGPQGFYDIPLASPGPVVLGLDLRIVLTAVSMAGVLCVVACLLRVARQPSPAVQAELAGLAGLSWKQLAFLLGPFTLAYLMLLVPRSAGNLRDRYLLALMFVAALALVRAYQDFVQPALPAASVAALVLVSLFGIAATHDMFALYRARLAIVNEMTAAGVADNTIDAGFDYDNWVELEHWGHINDDRIVKPPNAYVPVDKYRGFTCRGKTETNAGLLHVMPLYGIAYKPDACHGAAPFAPVTYFHWLGLRPTTLYAVKYGPF